MELHYKKYGEGKPLIILHGVFGISDNWVTIAKRLAKLGYEVYVPDQRNHGRSPHHYAFNYYALTEDLVEFFEQHGEVCPAGWQKGSKGMQATPDGVAKYLSDNADNL